MGDFIENNTVKACYWQQQNLILHIFLQPKASCDKFMGLHNDEIKLCITAPPIDGKANSHLIKFLAKEFRLAKSQITLEKGDKSRHKKVNLLNPKIIPEFIEQLLSAKE